MRKKLLKILGIVLVVLFIQGCATISNYMLKTTDQEFILQDQGLALIYVENISSNASMIPLMLFVTEVNPYLSKPKVKAYRYSVVSKERKASLFSLFLKPGLYRLEGVTVNKGSGYAWPVEKMFEVKVGNVGYFGTISLNEQKGSFNYDKSDEKIDFFKLKFPSLEGYNISKEQMF